MSEEKDSAPTGTAAIRDKNKRVREEAAEKRRKKREAAVARPVPARAGGLDAGEMVDDALARGTHALTGWLKRNVNILQWVVVLGLAGGIGFQIYRHQRDKSEATATDLLMVGATAEFARVGTEPSEADPRTGIEDTRPSFADHAARLAAAVKGYRAAAGSDTLGTLARTGLAGALFDQGKFQEALTEYRAVRQSALAEKDPDLRCRAIEGIGMSEEGLGHIDLAQKAYVELGKSDVPGFGPLGLYHQARLHHQKGETDKAKELLKSALEKLEKARGSDGDPTFTEQVARDLLMTIDPSLASTAAQGPRLTPEQIRAITEKAGGESSQSGGMDVNKLNELLRQVTGKEPVALPSGAPETPAPPASAP